MNQTSHGQQTGNRNSKYASLTAEQLNKIQENMASSKDKPSFILKSELYDKPTVIELERLDSDAYGGAPFVFKALKKPAIEIERQYSRMGKIQDTVSSTVRTYSCIIKNVGLLLILALYTAYFIWALVYNIDGATALIVLTCIAVAIIIYSYVSNHYGGSIYKHFLKPLGDFTATHWPWARW